MKKIFLLIIAVSLTSFLYGQESLSDERTEIQQTVINMFQALSDRDSTSLKNYCTSDVTFYEYGQIWTLDSLITKAIKTNHSADFKRTNSFEFITTESSKTTAWVTYRLNSTIIKDAIQSNIHWLETIILVKPEKQWKVKHLHSTRIKKS